MSIVRKPDNNDEVGRGNANADAYVMGHGNTKVAVLRKADLAADEAFVLIDLSDTTNFPHTETGKIRLYSLTVTTEKKADGVYILYIGVITEVDGTDGSTKWLMVLDLESVLNPTDSTDRGVWQFRWPNGLDLEVSAGVLVNMVANSGHSSNVAWNTVASLDSPIGDTASLPGAGDLVMYVDEISGTGTLSITVTVEYVTEEA